MEHIKISIIVPIYNAEQLISKCVDSILSQTERSLELLLVDDGSLDNSGELCDKYAQQDSRVKVIHQKNAGVSTARNRGIATAVGEYIGFVDSDDWIEPDMFERLLNEAENTGSDVVMCDATTVYSNGRTQADTITQLSGNHVLKRPDFTPALLIEMAGSVWRCIYKNDRYSTKPHKYPLLFPVGVKFSEDRIFNLYAFGQANQVAYLKKSYYNRYINAESAVHRFHVDYFEAYKKAAFEINKVITAVWNNNQELQKAYSGQLISGALGAICNYFYKTSTLSSIERKKMVRKLCNDRKLRTAIEEYGADRKSQWILDKKYSLLIVYAKLANWKHGR